jgi:DNA-binding transcriptional regulator YdaS (Cro superfamily)
MDELLEYLNSLAREEQEDLATRCDTTVGYLRKAISVGQKLRTELAVDLDRETGGKVSCSRLRPDIDWEYLRAREA